MEEFRLKALKHFNERPVPTWGVDLSPIKFQDFYYYAQPCEGDRQEVGGRPPGDTQHLREAGHPRGREEVPRRRGRHLREPGGLQQPPEGPAGAGSHLHQRRQRGAGLPRAHQEVHGDHHPLERQQVRRAEQRGLERRAFHLHPRGGQDHDAPSVVLQDQRAGDGAVREDAHRGRAQQRGPLHRGVHRRDVPKVDAPRGHRRARREEGREDTLHHDPELEQERLQPRHQEGARLRGRQRDVAQRRGRLRQEHEVPLRSTSSARAPQRRSSRWPTPAPTRYRTREAR